MTRIAHRDAYPGIRFLPRSLNLWARLKGVPAECEHLDRDASWTAILVPDTLYLRGKGRARREPVRPEVSLCRQCLLNVIWDELAAYEGRVVAFEPDAESFSQYFFVEGEDFEAAGVMPEVAAAIRQRLVGAGEVCARCPEAARWIWFSRADVGSLDESDRIANEHGEPLCSAHGAQKMCRTLEDIPTANLFYVNLPYGDAGAYLWI